MRVLDLFSGIGGFSLGLERAGMETVAFCEIDPYCRQVLAKHWPNVPIHDDIRTIDATRLGRIDLVCGGYPCQPFSVAGERRGSEDDRHLWPEMHRIVDELRPTWVIGENVSGHINLGLDEVLADLEASGYSARPFVVPACAVDAPHRRDRVWIVAHSERSHGDGGCGERSGPTSAGARAATDGSGCDAGAVADTAWDVEGRQEQWPERQRTRQSRKSEPVAHTGRRCSEGPRSSVGGEEGPTWWFPEPGLGRMDDGLSCWLDEPAGVPKVATGIPDRAHRLRALGNAVVPQIPEIIGRVIMAANHPTTTREADS